MTDNLDVNGDLNVNGNSNQFGNSYQTGDSTLLGNQTTYGVTNTGALDVNGNTSINGDLTVGGTDISGAIDNLQSDIDAVTNSITNRLTNVSTTIDGGLHISSDLSVSGSLNISNDTGTFFMNEFGNAGIYAHGDASPTADNQVQLGVGGTSITVENDMFIFRTSTDSVELSIDELSRLKESVAPLDLSDLDSAGQNLMSLPT